MHSTQCMMCAWKLRCAIKPSWASNVAARAHSTFSQIESASICKRSAIGFSLSGLQTANVNEPYNMLLTACGSEFSK